MRRPATGPSIKSVPLDAQQAIEEFGAEPWTGYAVAGEVAQGLAREWAEKHHAERDRRKEPR